MLNTADSLCGESQDGYMTPTGGIDLRASGIISPDEWEGTKCFSLGFRAKISNLLELGPAKRRASPAKFKNPVPVLTFRKKLRAAFQLAVSSGTSRAATFVLRIFSGPLLHPVGNERTNEVERLVQQLSSPRSSAREEAARVLSAYASVEPSYRAWIAREGAIPKLVPMLKASGMGGRCAAADALGHMAIDPQVRMEIMDADPTARLMKLVRRRYTYRVRASCTRALARLAADPDNAKLLLQNELLTPQLIKAAVKLTDEISAAPGRYVRERSKCALLSATLELLARLAVHNEVRDAIASHRDFFALLCKKMYFLDASVENSAMDLTVQLVKVETLKAQFIERGMLTHLSKTWHLASGVAQVNALRVLAELATSPTTHNIIHNTIKTSRANLSRGRVQALFGSFDGGEDSIGVFNLASCVPLNRGTSSYLHKSGVAQTVMSYLELKDPRIAASVCRLTGSLAAGEEIRQDLDEGGALSYLAEYVFWDDFEVVESALVALGKFADSECCMDEICTPEFLEKLFELQDMDGDSLICAALELLRLLARSNSVKETLRTINLHVR
ncbi:hypothetical protein BSKO_02137 [Bryopsis sp. KO-2023]|nr:hypothetical protein BSKO_02137 [Bryopsis sp. KO-2023]